ncbi:MAG: hypothetical protein KIT72_13220 [Polyangiaceae bacterium]|nr:hypothetical protein [Polyangiaceae bacterium]MCW5791372.1 hypothetical protein [Polyangiaceae bacterium]
MSFALRPLVWLQLLLAWGLVGCEASPRAPVQLALGAGEPLVLTPKVAFAEYIELPGLRHELRLTIADYEEASCEAFVPPREGQAMLSVVIATPPAAPIVPGTYAWAGAELRGSSASQQVHPVAEPLARVGEQSYLFEAGGGVQLQVVNLDAYGEVSGVLAFEAPAQAARGPTWIRGRFRAPICRSAPAPAPE